MTDVVLDPEAVPAPQTWLEEVCDALHMKRKVLTAVTPSIVDLVHHVAESPGDQDDAPLTAFLIGFAAAKDGDFSAEAVQSRVNIVARVLENHK